MRTAQSRSVDRSGLHESRRIKLTVSRSPQKKLRFTASRLLAIRESWSGAEKIRRDFRLSDVTWIVLKQFQEWLSIKSLD